MNESLVTRREALVERKRNSRDAMHRRGLQFHAFRLGVTLIELLITITIIATLSAAFLGASRSATEAARAARTKTMIAKLNGLLMERLATYSTRRADIYSDLKAKADSFTDQDRGHAIQDLRLLARRELMKLEMPDRWSDILRAPVGSTPQLPQILANRPSLTQSYLRRYMSLLPDRSKPEGQDQIRRNQGAECLYMIIMLSTDDGEARTLFSQQDIGDTDEDGAPEFLDGWGNPIQYIRWPAGFTLSQVMSRDSSADHDPFDHFRRDAANTSGPVADDYGGSLRWRVVDHLLGLRDPNDYSNSAVGQYQLFGGYRLVPLIYSRGSDGDSDLVVHPTTVMGLDPYAPSKSSTSDVLQLAEVRDSENDGEGWHDNIHNHLLDGR